MTTSELSGILRRRWYVVLLGLAVVAAALAYVSSRPGVYWSQVDVVILAPKSARFPNVIEQTSASLVSMAGLIERDVNKGMIAPATSSTGVTLAGEGVRDGHSIKLPNSGGQWANNFDRPVLDIQVVGADQEGVRSKLAAMVDLVKDDLKARQDADHIPRVTRITASSAPSSPPIFYLGGNRKKAAAATLLLGGLLTSVFTVGVDALLNTRARRRRARVTIARAGLIA